MACADGVAGWPGTEPYDRVIATAAVLVGRLPYARVRQTRPGGLILTPWVDHGKPVRTRCGLTLTAESQRIWLGEPANTIDG